MAETVTRTDISRAADRLAGNLRRTPVITVDGAELDTLGTVTLKLEFLQHTGTFKARGATNFMLSGHVGQAGVTAASGGNHGAAVAWAAQQQGHKAHIFVPTIVSASKLERLTSYGAEVTQIGDVYSEALAACNQFTAESGATTVHAYDDETVMAGAGTAGLELERQSAPIDTVLVACGGGGLVGGIASWFADQPRPVEIVACETEGTAAYRAAMQAGAPTDVEVGGVAADSLGATRIGEMAFAALSKVRAASVLVSDAEVIEARRFMWATYRVLLEPAAAVPIAALRSGAFIPVKGSHTAVVVCGANTPLEAS